MNAMKARIHQGLAIRERSQSSTAVAAECPGRLWFLWETQIRYRRDACATLGARRDAFDLTLNILTTITTKQPTKGNAP
jgi:hypothetical protein